MVVHWAWSLVESSAVYLGVGRVFQRDDSTAVERVETMETLLAVCLVVRKAAWMAGNWVNCSVESSVARKACEALGKVG